MHVYIVNVKKFTQIEVFDNLESFYKIKESSHPWYVMHENSYTDEEFQEICKSAMKDSEERWGIANVLHPFVSTLKDKYGFKDLVVSGRFEFETR